MIHSGKSAVVLGLGGSGEAAARLLREEGATVTVCDSGKSDALLRKAAALESEGIHVLLGDAADNDPKSYDLCVLSPGIDPLTPLVQNVTLKLIPVIGEIELAFEECACPVVAITGTNGKTTTTELTTKILSDCGLRTVACGNIGLPFSDAVRRSNELDVIVLETSSFQLETVVHFRAHVAVWLNFSPNHLDRYPDVDAYRAAKLRIFERQTPQDFAIVNATEAVNTGHARRLTFSSVEPNADFTFDGDIIRFRGEPVISLSDTRLRGSHNAENLMAALAIGRALEVDLDKLAAASRDYTPPAHRCEPVTTLGGVEWINDSKSTTLDAMEKAIFTMDRPFVLIAGGKDKGFDFKPARDIVKSRAKAAVLIGEMRDRIASDWSGVRCELAEDLEQAVTLASTLAESGDAVLFSPGTSSFDMFRSYIERGDRFKSAVKSLSDPTNPTTPPTP